MLCILFQSTHPHGVRRTAATATAATTDFNPRTRMGCDFAFSPAHAEQIDFNPRTRMGCDALLVSSKTICRYFNPRTRMGCD